MQLVRILLVEDNPGDARLLREALAEIRSTRFDITQAETLAKAVDFISDRARSFDVILLDLMVPDSQGLATFARMYTRAPEVPIVILSGISDDSLAVEAVQAGAEDYLVKGQVAGHLLARTVNHAIERHQMQTALRSLSILDELAGLYSRRGFLPLAQQYLVLAQSGHTELALFLVELQPAAPKISRLDPLQEHQSLVRTAELLKRTFRTGDLLAHLGENLFVVLAMGANRDIAGSLRVRLQQNLAEQNSRSGAASPLTLKVGVSLFNPKAPTSLNELLAEADRALFAQG